MATASLSGLRGSYPTGIVELLFNAVPRVLGFTELWSTAELYAALVASELVNSGY
jgi:hypothetical protein